MNNKIDAVMFDLGNVLLDFDHRIAAERICGFTDKDRDEIFNLFFDSELTGLFEEGKVSPAEFFAKVKEALTLRLDYAEFVPIWNEIFFFSEKNLSVYNLAASLKDRYRVMLISNINILHFEYVKRTFPILDAFNNIITSFEAGVRKPHPLIFKKALEALGYPAQNVFYTDDRPELIAGARQLGIRSFVFNNPQELRKNLSESGVKCLDP